MLFHFAPDRRAPDLVMNSIAPIWDGNETWLILGSVGLFAIFPVAFAIIISAVYFPILLMLLALIFRGLAFEFRYWDAEHRWFWDHGFAYGSAVAAFSQGVVLGSSSSDSRSKGDTSSVARLIASRAFRSSLVSL
jgi:cytochrome d ubiquinol oxidase subunit II